MSKIRVQVITRRATTIAENYIVNTVYFDDFNIDPTGGTNWQAFADQVRDVFRARGGTPGGIGVETKVYDMADAEPRPIKAVGAYLQSNSQSAGTIPREVALCLSYYSERNIPRFRGRLYIGPWNEGSERPSQSQTDTVRLMAAELGAVGGPDVDWGLWSPTRAAFSKVTAGWVDDEWDTVRSRGLRPTLRNPYTTSE